MKVAIELNTFSALQHNSWSGAIDTLAMIEKYGKQEELMEYLDNIFYDTIPTETELNDFLWFEPEMIFEDVLGFDPYDVQEDEEKEED